MRIIRKKCIQLKQFRLEKSGVYLLSYIYFQYQKINDHLIQAFAKQIRKYQGAGKEYMKLRQHEEASIVAQRMEGVSEILNLSVGVL